MARAKKFGTFSGVFTPSILTILGVIMYLRLPTIVGQAGLFATLGIIIVAHIISITTGLSVSSIATDKKVKAGGTYFMISRSLGLPIGGTLGLALFVGLSFSVSLYLIGFAESFLGFWDLGVTKNTIRITGTIMLLLVTGVTLISTALALKTQFYIMAAIGLSLLSIFFGRHDFAPAEPLLSAVPDAAPFIVLFGIFFPAVTGFEAGVSMSGDLQDPKRSIPGGTIAAITVGFVMYIGLAIFFSYTVSADQLAGNPNVLLDISLFPPLVVAGIWGATISSAFGSILGAPRILQATSVDRITPQWFARGYGAENEPRHALLLAFLIAEAGILIGELDVIARIVSMFFITTYGFLNLSAAIENWASPDFRPEFRVPTFVGIIGSLACFIVMIQLDFVAMVGASILLGAVYLYLTRKQLTLQTGDTWEGFWSSVVRSGLHRLSRGFSHVRNWRPNILLFSGRPETRADLIEFGRHLVHRRGVLTSFELFDADGPEEPAVTQAAAEEDPFGVFHRRAACDDVFDGIESIARYHGYAGVEPNTVLLAWTRGSRDPRRFVQLIQSLAQMDHNVLLMDYDQERGFGEHERIDVWLRGPDSNVGLALALVRFLSIADTWRGARTRFLALNDQDAGYGTALHRALARMLVESRVDADIRIVQNTVDARPFASIVRHESIDADLVIIGLDDIGEQGAAAFVAETQRIVDDLGSVLLVRASSFFEAPFVRPERIAEAAPAPDADTALAAADFVRSITARDDAIAGLVFTVADVLHTSLHDRLESPLRRAFATQRTLLQDLAGTVRESLQRLARDDSPRDSVARTRVAFLNEVLARWTADAALFEGPRDDLMAALGEHERALRETIESAPRVVTIVPEPERFQVGATDTPRMRRVKFRRRRVAALLRREPRYDVHWQRLLEHDLLPGQAHALQAVLAALGQDGRLVVEQARDMMLATLEALARIEHGAADSAAPAGNGAAVAREEEALARTIGGLIAAHRDAEAAALEGLYRGTRLTLEMIADRSARVDVDQLTRRGGPVRREASAALGEAAAFPEIWMSGQQLFLADAVLTARLRLLMSTATTMVERAAGTLSTAVVEAVDRLKKLHGELETLQPDAGSDPLAGAADITFPLPVSEIVQTLRAGLRDAVATLPEDVTVPDEESLGRAAEQPLAGVDPSAVRLRRYADYVMETELVGPVQAVLTRAATTLDDAAEVAREVVRLTIFSVGDEGGTRSAVESGSDRLEQQTATLEQAGADALSAIDRRLTDASARLEPAVLVRAAATIDRGLRGHRGQNVATSFSRAGARLRQAVRGRVADLVYQRSEGVLLARELRATDATRRPTGDALIDVTGSVSPRPEVLNALPFYYRQLFLGKPTMTQDFWIGWARELELARRAVDQYRSGHPGALLILGESDSGRTSLSWHIAESCFPARAIHRVHPPEGGSIDPGAFATRFRRALGMTGSPESIVRTLPRDSVVILDDFGLWWERSRDGFVVIDKILDLIRRNADRCLFIVNANIHTFGFMNRMRLIEDHFMNVISLQPFSAREIGEVIMLRHQSTGLVFELGGRSEEEISDLRLARLFNDHFDYSGGVLGAALHAWVVHITGVSGDRLSIESPEKPRLDVLDRLDTLQLVLLLQFVLHERLTMERLERVIDGDAPRLRREITMLRRADVLVEGSGGGIELNPYLQPHLVRYLRARELL